MNPQILTLISGVVLLLVFALVGWRVRRRKTAADVEQQSGTRKKSES